MLNHWWSSGGLWHLAANYFHFRQDNTGPYTLTDLLSLQPPSAAIESGRQQSVPSAKRSWKIIHTAKSTLLGSSFSQIVTSSVAKKMATLYWPHPIPSLSQEANKQPQPFSQAHPALCAFWLLQASCLTQLSQLSEQLLQDVLMMAEKTKDIVSEESRAAFQRYASDFEAVDGVLLQAMREGLPQCAGFHNFYHLWKEQLRFLCSPIHACSAEDTSYFSQLVLSILETEQVCTIRTHSH